MRDAVAKAGTKRPAAPRNPREGADAADIITRTRTAERTTANRDHEENIDTTIIITIPTPRPAPTANVAS